QLSVTDGGHVTISNASFFALGINPGEVGSATVSGSGSSIIDTGPVIIGFSGQGILTISNDGLLQTNSPGVGGSLVGVGDGSGLVEIRGATPLSTSEWHVLSNLGVGTGTVRLGGFAFSNTPGASGATLRVDGTLTVLSRCRIE